MPREQNLEVKVGIFVILALVCLVGFIFSISDFSIFKGGQVYRVMFNYANGLKKSAPVRISGVDAGHVRTIKVYFDQAKGKVMVEVEAWINNGIRLPADSVFEVNQLGLLGEKYLEILPGVATDIIQPGSVVSGEDPVSMELVMKQLSALVPRAQATLDGINNGILSEANKQSLAAALANMATATEKFNNGVLTEANKQSLAAALSNIAAISGKINTGEGTVGKFLTDPAFFNNLEELSADVKANPWKLFYRPKGK